MSEKLITLRYTGTGLGMLWRVIFGFFLMMITLGIYYPWFMNSLIGYACSHVEVNDPPGGIQPNVRFTGSGLGLLLRYRMVSPDLPDAWALRTVGVERHLSLCGREHRDRSWLTFQKLGREYLSNI